MSYTVENYQQQSHPEMEQLIEYIKNINSCNEGSLCLHLAECENCRRHTEIISLLMQHLPVLSASMINIEQHNMIIDFIAGNIDRNKLKDIRLSIINDPKMLQAALYYASHSNAMNHEIENKDTHRMQIAGKSENNTLLIKMIKKSMDVLMKWLYVISGKLSNLKWLKSKYFYVTAIIIFAVFIILLRSSFFTAEKKNTLFAVSYQDNPVIEFKDADLSPVTDSFAQKNFNTVTVNVINDKKIKISWPEIKHVSEYTIRLQQNRNGKIVLLQRHSVSHPYSIFDFSATNRRILETGKRYEWILSGRTDANKSYYAKGGFVLTGKMNP